MVIVADGDEPGRGGADNLASVLVAYAPAVRLIEPPEGIKDVRDWLRVGGRRSDVEQRIAAAGVRRLAISFGMGRGLNPEKSGSSIGDSSCSTRSPFFPSAT